MQEKQDWETKQAFIRQKEPLLRTEVSEFPQDQEGKTSYSTCALDVVLKIINEISLAGVMVL